MATVKPGGAGDLDIVGGPPGWAAWAARIAARSKALRGLGTPQPVTRSSVPATVAPPRHSASVTASAGAAPWVIGKRVDHGIDHRARYQRAGHVMDQHPRSAAATRGRDRPDRGVARRAAR
jgi:hypothetical protein